MTTCICTQPGVYRRRGMSAWSWQLPLIPCSLHLCTAERRKRAGTRRNWFLFLTVHKDWLPELQDDLYCLQLSLFLHRHPHKTRWKLYAYRYSVNC